MALNLNERMNIHIEAEYQAALDEIGRTLADEGMLGIVRKDGGVNRSLVIKYLVRQEAKRRDLQGTEALR